MNHSCDHFLFPDIITLINNRYLQLQKYKTKLYDIPGTHVNLSWFRVLFQLLYIVICYDFYNKSVYYTLAMLNYMTLQKY